VLGLLMGKQVARKWNEIERERGWNRYRNMYEDRERTLNGQIDAQKKKKLQNFKQTTSWNNSMR